MKTVEFYAKPRIVGNGSIGITLPNRELDRINAIPKKLLEQWVKFVAEVPDEAVQKRKVNKEPVGSDGTIPA